jgi:four helix bundle protein
VDRQVKNDPTERRARRPIRSFRDLEVYQRGRDALRDVHALAATFPDYEKYDLADQMRRASKSVTSTIAEGWAKRASAQEFKRYLRMSLGSANEMESHVETALDLGSLTKEDASTLAEHYRVIGAQLNRLIANWKTFGVPPSILHRPSSRRDDSA